MKTITHDHIADQNGRGVWLGEANGVLVNRPSQR